MPSYTLFSEVEVRAKVGEEVEVWIDEEAAIYAMCQLNNQRVTTKFMSEIDFILILSFRKIHEHFLFLIQSFVDQAQCIFVLYSFG